MAASKFNNPTHCSAYEINSYLDSVLNQEQILVLEEHVKTCSRCRSELDLQRSVIERLSDRINTDPVLPGNFAKVVATRARSNVRRTRHTREIGIAILIALGLMAPLVFVLGMDLGVLASTASVVPERLYAVVAIIASAMVNFAYAITVIVKNLFGQPIGIFILGAGLALAILVTPFYLFRNKIRRFFVIPASK